MSLGNANFLVDDRDACEVLTDDAVRFDIGISFYCSLKSDLITNHLYLYFAVFFSGW